MSCGRKLVSGELRIVLSIDQISEGEVSEDANADVGGVREG